MTKDEVLRLAFEALHYCEALNSSVEKQKMQAITAIKKTLEQPEREWVGLTDEERDECLGNYITAEGRARAIEAKLKQKNGYAEEKNT